MPKPAIAAVHGAVAGFGMSLMSACDLAVASENAFFTLAYCHIGVSPDGSSTYTLPRSVGLKRSFEMAYLGERFGAEEAKAMGLVNRVVRRGRVRVRGRRARADASRRARPAPMPTPRRS